MITINIAKDFSASPGARNYTDGMYSGEEFYDKMLKPKYAEAISKNLKLRVILDGTNGMASSFINESFRKLGAEYGADSVWSNLILVSDEVPKYMKKVKEAVYEAQ